VRGDSPHDRAGSRRDPGCSSLDGGYRMMRLWENSFLPLTDGRRSLNRGRDAHYWAPPAQNRTDAIPADGSHLGCLTGKR
jgi:hypothetical protein